MLSAQALAQEEQRVFFDRVMRPSCEHVTARRDLRQVEGKICCELCGSPLVPVKR